MFTKPNILVLLTAEFPYGKGEPFVAPEIEILAKHFDKVVVIPDSRQTEKRPVPSNVEILHLKPLVGISSKIALLGALFYVSFWKELVFTQQVLKIKFSWRLFKIALRYMADSLLWAERIKKAFPENDGRYVFYTYWCDAKSLALTHLKLNGNKNRFVSRLHGWDVYQERHNPPYLPFRKAMVDGLDALVFISEHGRQYVKQTWKIEDDTRLKLYKLGTQAPLTKQRSGALKLFSCSSMIPLKRVSLIADAVLALGGKISWIHLGDGPLMAEIRKKVDDNKAWDYVQLLGSVHNQEIHKVYAENPDSIFINLSESEGLPVSVMEAMSYGFPVIATDVGGTGEIVDNRFNGILLPANASLNEVLEAINSLVYNSEFRKTLAENANKTWEISYRSKKNFEDFAQFLQAPYEP